MTRHGVDETVLTTVLLALWRRGTSTMGELAQTAHRPTAVIASALRELQRRNCVLDHTPSAVHLVSTGLACWRDVIERTAAAQGRIVGRRAMIFDQTASTNDVAWSAARGPSAHGLVVAADLQTAGRGRRGNAWVAKPGQSLLLSVLLREDANPETLTLLAGLAAAEAIASVSHLDVEIKWPNDVLVTGGHARRKVAGVLVEKRGRHAVVGIGVNVAQAAGDFPPGLRGKATSLYMETGRQMDRLTLLIALLDHVECRCVTPAADGHWLAAWKARCQMFGQTVDVRTGPGAGRRVRGRVVDVDPLQGLAVRDEAGAMHFCSAQTSTLGGV